MSNCLLRSRVVARALFVTSLVFALALVPAAAAAKGSGAKHRRATAGWIRVYPHTNKHHATKKKRQQARNTVDKSAPSPVANPYGIAAGGNLHNLSPDELARELDVYRAAGARWIRIDINWEVIQAGGPSSYNWEPFDRIVRASTDHGLRILAGILYTPAWARPGTASGVYPPADLGNYAEFCRAAVSRYAPMGVHHWEVWNEPNRGFWKPAADPVRYTQMLRLAYSAIKHEDAQAFVVSAGLSPYGAYGQSDGEGMNPLTFLERMYKAGAAGSFDALGWHPYEWGVGVRYHPMSAWSQVVDTPTNARSIMVANGDGRKQIWGTEYGAPSGATMPEEAQAGLLRSAYEEWGQRDWAGPLFWYSARDAGTNPRDREHNFGLVHRDFSPKPSLSAYRALAHA